MISTLGTAQGGVGPAAQEWRSRAPDPELRRGKASQGPRPKVQRGDSASRSSPEPSGLRSAVGAPGPDPRAQN